MSTDRAVASSAPDARRVTDVEALARELGLLRVRAAQGTPTARVSLDELARRIDQPRSTVHAYVTGKHMPPSAVLDSMVIALGATPAEQRLWNDAWYRVAADAEDRRRTRGPDPAGSSRADVPKELPTDVEHFTGRVPELAELDKVIGVARRPHDAVPIAAVTGSAGVGKTALALHWAHRCAQLFPDGQLYLDLRGYDPDQPVDAEAALGRLLRVLLRDGRGIPTGVDEQAALYRSLLAGRSMLVLLDNANDTEQIRLLLPGAATCAVVVTSRESLAGLMARYGAHRVDLDVLVPSDAHDLLRRLIGDRVGSDAPAAAEVARMCGYLPLALRIAAERVASHTGESLETLAHDLADERERLDLLDADEDQRTAVRAVFSWSYRHLDPASAEAFRRFGLLPGADADGDALAALLDGDAATARRSLRRLTRAHLAHEATPGRLAQHELLRLYAAGLAADDLEADRRAALARLFDHYVGRSARAMDVLYPSERHRRPEVKRSAHGAWEPSDEPAARRWLDTELPNLVAAAARMDTDGWTKHVVALSGTLGRHLETGGHYLAAHSIHGHALAAAERDRDSAGQAVALFGLATLDYHFGDLQTARDRLAAARACYAEVGDRVGEIRMLNNLGLILEFSGEPDRAIGYYQAALEFYREVDDELGEGHATFNLGRATARTGREDEAADHFAGALALYRRIGNRLCEAGVLTELGALHAREARYGAAIECHRASVAICRDIGSVPTEAEALFGLGAAYRATGRNDEALQCLEGALRKYPDTDAVGEASGGPVGADKRTPRAADPQLRARTHDSLGDTHLALGDRDRAHEQWTLALAAYHTMARPEADEIRAKLSGLADR